MSAATAAGAAPKGDLVVLATALALGAVTLGLAVRTSPITSASDRTAPVVATVRLASGTLRVRAARTLGWEDLVPGQSVHDADSVFVPPGAEAKLEFVDGTVLELDERSLVVVEPGNGATRRVTLRQGSVSGRVGATALTLATPGGEAKLSPSAVARVELNEGKLGVAVKQGTGTVISSAGQVTVKPGERASSSSGAAPLALVAFAVELETPAANHRVIFQNVPAPVTLTWKVPAPDGAKLQVARDRLFAFVTTTAGAEGGRYVLQTVAPGVTWWRVVDARGEPLSEARRFTLVEDVAPATMSPRDGEVVLAPLGTQVAFSWVPLDGVSNYQLEVSGSKSFEPIVQAEVVQGAQAKLTLSLNEGAWYWRLRGTDDVLGVSQYSEPSRFRVIHKGIPDAPELLTPTIEVVP